MKVKIKYTIHYEKEVEMTPLEYCELHATMNNSAVFPENSVCRQMEAYQDLDEASRNELENFWDRG